MKKSLYILSFIFIFFIFAMPTSASQELYKIKIIESYANMRASGNSSSSLVEKLEQGTVHTLLSTELTNNYYKIESSSGKIGYIHENYAMPFLNTNNTEPTTVCEKELYANGFTDPSYWPSLCYLKEIHPTWIFTAQNTNLDWKTSVEKESVCGKSYTTKTGDYIDTTCKNQYTHTWYPASQKALSYYMDPRNFLNEKYIFQFERISYDTNIGDEYISIVENMIDHTAFYTYHDLLGNDLAAIINTVALKETVQASPVFIAARIVQELGSSNSLYNLYSGAYTEYDNAYLGYYNFYNWGVSDTCATTYGASYCGLSTAKRYEWNSVEAAVEGGVSFISTNYIQANQDTLYLQKFNVMPENVNELYGHQYMTNIHAPTSEGESFSENYRSAGFLENSFEFLIPVYNDMAAVIDNDGSGATGEDGDDELSTLDIDTIVTNSGYSRSNNILSKIAVETDVSEVLSSLEGVAGKGNVSITDKNNVSFSTGFIKTGDKITIKNETETITLTVVIYGDTSGDGKVSALDLLQVQQSILGIYTLNNEYLLAGDTSKDGKITAIDLLQVQQSILQIYTIIQ